MTPDRTPLGRLINALQILMPAVQRMADTSPQQLDAARLA